MPPKKDSNKKDSNEKSWSDKEKLAFYVSLIESGAATIDWSRVTLPKGKTRNAVTKMMKRTKEQLKPELDALKASQEEDDDITTVKKERSKTPKVTDDEDEKKTKRPRAKSTAGDESNTRVKKQKV
ncbi:uncharacterized protein K452DRAFT_314466 [Aplosporella prunicola CBS 121167]|uniref:Myb-like domain-containing protein n=1 Tax=Aplosporella prunicola CBS 121167 TaxID=1176127 RepID=A0A6A6BWI1_9PEZI|nr:uncharacterized protein K452DRAFT_314466 [Aplosporella prunicola CBS 121167]KAF2147267.1 hypothetical protein K452DRAFT_314466 [Aplosporella prunicola CBS 121167]